MVQAKAKKNKLILKFEGKHTVKTGSDIHVSSKAAWQKIKPGIFVDNYCVSGNSYRSLFSWVSKKKKLKEELIQAFQKHWGLNSFQLVSINKNENDQKSEKGQTQEIRSEIHFSKK